MSGRIDERFINQQVKNVLGQMRLEDAGPWRIAIQHMGEEYDTLIAGQVAYKMRMKRGKPGKVQVVGAGWLYIEEGA